MTRQPTFLGNISREDSVTEDLPNFMEEVETYMTYKVASYINRYWFAVLVPTGLVGNILSFLVMTKPNNRKVSTCIYMAAISVNDNLMIGLALHDWLVGAVNIHNWHVQECKIAAYFDKISLQTATYQVLAMTVDKYVAIRWPHRAATYSTPRRAKFIILGILIFTFTYNIPHLFVANLMGYECLSYLVGGTITKVYSWITFFVNGIIPFSMLIYINYIIVQTVRNSRKMFVVTSNRERYSDSIQGIDTRQKIMKSAENQLTIMLLLVTLLFSILLIPTYIRFIYLTFVKSDTPAKFARSVLLFQITYKLYVTNNGINFFLYCISGRKFRNDLKEILCCARKSPKAMTDKTETKCQSQSEMTNLSA